jgi:THO complex subunit 2
LVDEQRTKNKEQRTKNKEQRTKNKEQRTKNQSDASGQKRSENLAEVLDTKAKTPQTFMSVGQTNRLYNSIDV